MQKKLIPRFRSPDIHKSDAKRAENGRLIAVEALILSLSALKQTVDTIPPPAGLIIAGSLTGLLRVLDIVKVSLQFDMFISGKRSDMTTLQTTGQNANDIDQLVNRVKTLERSIFRPLRNKAIPESTVELVTNFAK